MRHVLVYGDSLSWGFIPGERKRLPFEQRWPGVVDGLLDGVRVAENCLNGRRTAFEDPFKPGRRGLDGFEQTMEIHSPLDLLILMLGSNDFQSMHAHNATHAASGIEALVKAARRAPLEPGIAAPKILIVAPPPVFEPKGFVEAKFAGAGERCAGLAAEYQRVADDLDCAFFDAGSVVAVSPVDGVHLDAEAQGKLGRALAPVVEGLVTP